MGGRLSRPRPRRQSGGRQGAGHPSATPEHPRPTLTIVSVISRLDAPRALVPLRKLPLLLALGALFLAGGLAAIVLRPSRPAIALTPSRPASVSPTNAPGIGVVSYGQLSSFSHVNQYAFVIGSSWSSGDTSVLERAAGRSLTYFDGMDVATSYSTGVTYSQALSNGWLLKNSSGHYLINKTYGTYCADVGSSAYQQAWISNVSRYLAARPGIDGIFIDNTISDPKAECGGYPAKYPSTAAYSAAMLAFVKTVYSALHAHGYYVALNAGAYIPGDSTYNDGSSTVNWWKELGSYADALMNEYYDETPTGTNQLRSSGTAWYQQWDSWQRLIGLAQSTGDDFLGLTKQTCTNTTAMMYGKASFLLEWNGGPSAFMFTCGSTDPANPAWTTSIGHPVGAKVQVGVGWQRFYSGGVVVVNPSPTSTQTFSLGGGYVDPSGVTVTTVTLQPTTAMISRALPGTTSGESDVTTAGAATTLVSGG
jgi:putative glycosyl hydrolase-like family 15 (GHL15) protein